MAIILINEFTTSSNSETQTPATISQDLLTKLTSLVGSSNGPSHVQIGRQVQSPGTIQITSEWANESSITDDTSPFARFLHSSFGTPSSSYLIPLSPSDSLFTTPTGAATRPTTEYVMSWHPNSRLTSNPSYQSQIEAEFAKFYSIFGREATGDSGLTSAWVSGDQKHAELPGGETARIFFVANGWDRMEAFETSCSTESFREAVPIVYGWGTPFKLWHVETILAI